MTTASRGPAPDAAKAARSSGGAKPPSWCSLRSCGFSAKVVPLAYALSSASSGSVSTTVFIFA